MKWCSSLHEHYTDVTVKYCEIVGIQSWNCSFEFFQLIPNEATDKGLDHHVTREGRGTSCNFLYLVLYLCVTALRDEYWLQFQSAVFFRSEANHFHIIERSYTRQYLSRLCSHFGCGAITKNAWDNSIVFFHWFQRYRSINHWTFMSPFQAESWSSLNAQKFLHISVSDYTR